MYKRQILDWYRELSVGNRQSVSAIFNYFSSGGLYARSLKVSISYAVKIFLWTLLIEVVYGFLMFEMCIRDRPYPVMCWRQALSLSLDVDYSAEERLLRRGRTYQEGRLGAKPYV